MRAVGLLFAGAFYVLHPQRWKHGASSCHYALLARTTRGVSSYT